MKCRYPLTFHLAFSLIELLAAISVVAILGTIIIGGLSSIRSRANRVEDASNMRQIGLAIHAFTLDSDGHLPGPLSGGQSALYPTVDNSQLLYFLEGYLPLSVIGTGRTRAKIMVSRAWERSVSLPDGRPYEANVSTVEMVGGERRIPFGYPNWSDRTLDASPNRLSDLLEPDKVWALRNLDQLNARAYAGNPAIPAIPIHGNLRNYLYFDNHVEAVPVP